MSPRNETPVTATVKAGKIATTRDVLLPAGNTKPVDIMSVVSYIHGERMCGEPTIHLGWDEYKA